MSKPKLKETVFGFQWGPLDIQRIFSLPGGGICLEFKTKYKTISMYVSPKGKNIRFFDNNEELKRR